VENGNWKKSEIEIGIEIGIEMEMETDNDMEPEIKLLPTFLMLNLLNLLQCPVHYLIVNFSY